MSKALFLQQTVGGSLSHSFWLAELHQYGLGKWGWLALPLPTAANKWQLAAQAGQAAVTPGRAANELSGCSGTTRQPARLWLERQREGPRAASQGCRVLSLGAPGRSAVPFTGSPTLGCLIFNFSDLLGEEGGLWGWCGKDGWEDCAARDRNLENFPLLDLSSRLGKRKILNPFAHSRPDGIGGVEGAGTGVSRGDYVLVANPGLASRTPGSWLESLTLYLDGVSPGTTLVT